MKTFTRMGVKYRLVETGDNRWGNGKVHILFYRRENREWRLLCRPEQYLSYFVHELANTTEPATCKICARKDPRES